MMRFATWAATMLGVAGLAAVPAQAMVGPGTAGSRIADSIVMLLTRSGTTAGFCTAIVLSPNVVMTAAHCVPPGADLRVHFPSAASEPVLLAVGAVLRHPGYRPDAITRLERSVDLALVRLVAPLPDRFVPATLARSSGATPGQLFTVSGFGLAREGDAASSGHLRSATLAARAPLSSLLLWADDPTHGGAGACTGDSGAPVLDGETATVTALVVWSAGLGRQHCGDLTQALWLAPQRDWIDAALQKWRDSR